jgi:hypothetical protein
VKLYVAGPMRGIPHFNFPAFHAATARLRAAGHEVFNPAERDIEATGVDISADNLTGNNEQAASNHGFSLREALADDLLFVCRHADGVVMLPGWVNSKGANAEVAAAIALDLRLFHCTDADPMVEIPKANRPATVLAEAS